MSEHGRTISTNLSPWLEAADIDTTVGFKEKNVQEWLAHLMSKIIALKETNNGLRSEVNSLKQANMLQRMKIMALKKNKANKSFCGKS